MNKLYNGLELSFNNWNGGEKAFWYDKADEYTEKWKVRFLDYGRIIHRCSHLWEPFPLGKFKHILETGNNDFEYKVFERGILRILKSETKKRIQKEIDDTHIFKWEIVWH